MNRPVVKMTETHTGGNTRHATAEEKTVLKTLPDFKTVTTGWTKDLTA